MGDNSSPITGDEKGANLILEPSSMRYEEDEDLDNLIATAISFFQEKDLETEYLGYMLGGQDYKLAVFENGRCKGALCFEYLPNFSDPNQNCPYLGEYADFYWYPDDTLIDLILERDWVRDLERLARPLEPKQDKQPEIVQPALDFRDWVTNTGDAEPMISLQTLADEFYSRDDDDNSLGVDANNQTLAFSLA